MVRTPLGTSFLCKDEAIGFGLTKLHICEGIGFVYSTLDKLDKTLLEAGSPRLTGLVELANLSSILGNLLATGIVKAAAKVFNRAGPHKYQDLRAIDEILHRNIEIKVSLETNNPKGHLAKEGHYLTCRYVLGDESGGYTIGKRGDVVWIWEVRFGHLSKKHFNISNTAGDSGKTAVVNAEGMSELEVVYFDSRFSPHKANSKYHKNIDALKLSQNRTRKGST